MWSKVFSSCAATTAIADRSIARSQEPFFARKTITISIGYTAGGSYDLYAPPDRAPSRQARSRVNRRWSPRTCPAPAA